MLRLLGVLALSCIAVGCASLAGDASGAQETNLDVNPAGPGGDCTLTFLFPADVATKAVFDDGTTTGAHLRIRYGGAEIKPGVPNRVRPFPDAEGFSHFTIEYTNFGHTLVYSERFALNAGETVTLGFGALRIDGWGLPATGPTIDLSGYTTNEQIQYVWNDVRYSKWTPAHFDQGGWWILKYGGPILPVLPGHYEYTFNNAAFPSTPLDVLANAVAPLDVTVTDPLGYVEILQETPGLANAVPPKATLSCANKSGPIDGQTQRASVFTTSDTSCTYAINGASSTPFKLSPKEHLQIQSHRLDVHDVTLTDEPGTPTVPGHYSISQWQSIQGKSVLDPVLTNLKTSTGVDVPSGAYRIEIHYRSPKGIDQTIVNDVTF